MNTTAMTELEARASALFESLGLDLDTAKRMFYIQALRCRGIPFEVRADEPNETTLAAMDAAESGDDVYGPFDSVEDLMEALDAEG